MTRRGGKQEMGKRRPSIGLLNIEFALLVMVTGYSLVRSILYWLS